MKEKYVKMGFRFFILIAVLIGLFRDGDVNLTLALLMGWVFEPFMIFVFSKEQSLDECDATTAEQTDKS